MWFVNYVIHGTRAKANLFQNAKVIRHATFYFFLKIQGGPRLAGQELLSGGQDLGMVDMTADV